MVDKKRRPKTIVYKQAQLKTGTATLQDCLDAALIKRALPAHRLESLDGDGGAEKRFINSFIKQKGMLFGQVLLYETGKDQTIVIVDENSKEYPVESLSLPKRRDGKDQEVLESVLYFGVLDNHVILAQSQALKARHVELHLYWLFRSCTDIFSEDQVFYLSDKPSASAIKKLESSPVKKVVLGATLDSEVYQSEGEELEETEIKQAKKVSFRPVGRAFDILSAALGPEWRKDVKLDEALDDANLQVNLEVTYVRKTTKTAHKLLDNIATSMRHAEPEDVKIVTDNGAVIKGNEIKMSSTVHVDTYNGVVDSNDMYQQMHAWLTERIKEGSVL